MSAMINLKATKKTPTIHINPVFTNNISVRGTAENEDTGTAREAHGPYEAMPVKAEVADILMEKDRQIYSCAVFEDDVGVGEDRNLMDLWITNMSNIDSARYIPSLRPAMKIAKCINKVLPVGSRRRNFAKKVYNGLKKVYHSIKPKKKNK
jgi:hypothetical protein